MNPALTLRLALAGLRRDRTTSLVAVGMLALGMAAPATFFSLLWGGGLRPLPVPEGGQVMRAEVLVAGGGGQRAEVGFRDVSLLEGVSGVQEVGAFEARPLAVSTRELATLSVSGAVMTPATLDLLRIPPLLGRIPGGREAEASLVLGHDLWTRHFGGDPEVLGRTVEVDGMPRTVVAVMPEGFRFPFRQSAWVLTDPAAPAEASAVEPVLRIEDGTRPELLSQRLTSRWRGADGLRPAEARDAVLRVRLFTRGRGEAGEGWAYVGLVLVGLCLLVIACVNAANLLLVRALDRIRTLGVQSALGASRAHLAAQLLLEALLLAGAGGLMGLVLAHFMVTWVQEVMGPENFGYYWMQMRIDAPVVLFTGVLVVGTALSAGTLPVVRVLRSDLQSVLKSGGEPAFAGPFRGWSWGRVFVTGQLGLSCFALVAAGLTAGSMLTAARYGAGMPGHEVLTGRFEFRGDAFRAPEDAREGMTRLEGALKGIPGAMGTALALGAPGYMEPWTRAEFMGGGVPLDAGDARDAELRVFANAVTPGFFSALDLGLRKGRPLGPEDVVGAAPVAVVTESLARELFPGVDPLGLSVRLAALDSARFFQVVGVVEDPRLNAGPRLREHWVYVPLSQVEARSGMLLVRGAVTPSLAGELRAAAGRVGSGVVLNEVRTLEDAYRFLTRAQSTLSALAVSGGLAGLLVAGVGLYALLAFRVRRGRKEMGIRLALGADGLRLARDVMGLALGQLLPGVVAGLVLAWLAAPLLGILLLGGDPRSPVAYAVVSGVFVIVGLLAALGPAVRASGLRPGEVLGVD